MLQRGSLPFLLVCLFCAGCGDDSEKVVGHWKSRDKTGVWYSLVEFTKNSMTLDGIVSDAVLETKDGKVVVRKAGTDSTLAIISIVDDNSLDIEMNGKKTRYVKSTEVENARLLAASPREKVIGFWKTRNHMTGGASILEIGADYFIDDGKDRIAITRTVEDNKLFLALTSGEKTASPSVVLHDDDHMELFSQWMGRNQYERISPDEAATFLSPPPELAYGFWKAGDSVLELSSKGMVQNGEMVPAVLVSGRKEILGLDPENRENVVVRIQIDDHDAIVVSNTASPFGNTEYVRISQEEAKAALDAVVKALERVVGVWMSEKVERYKQGGRDFMIIEKQTFSRGDGAEPSAMRLGGGGVEIFNPGQPHRVLARVKSVDDDTLVSTGGFMSSGECFVRTTRENMELLLNPKVDSLRGYWVSVSGNSWLSSDDSLRFDDSVLALNGIETAVAIRPEPGRLTVADASSSRTIGQVSFLNGDSMEFKSVYSNDPKTYRRASKEQADAVVAAYKAGLERILGFWLSEEEYRGRKIGRALVEITDSRLVFNAEGYGDYTPAFQNGRIYFADKAAPEKHYGHIEIVDDNSIQCRFISTSTGAYRRSSREEVDELMNPKQEKAFGFWINEEKNVLGLPRSILALDAQRIMLNGMETEVRYASGEGRLVVETPNRKDTLLVITRILPDRLIVDANIRYLTYLRTTKEAVQQVMQTYATYFRDNIVGYWKTKGVGGKPTILFITPDEIIRNGRTEIKGYRIGVDRGNFMLTADNASPIRIESITQNVIKYEYGSEFMKISKEEYEQLLALWR